MYFFREKGNKLKKKQNNMKFNDFKISLKESLGSVIIQNFEWKVHYAKLR